MTFLLHHLEKRTRTVVVLIAVVTALLAVPFLLMAPTESASTEPGGAVFDARDLVDERFVSSVHGVGFVAEHESGDLLRAEPLQGLLAAQQRVTSDPALADTLFSYYDVDAGVDVRGPFSIANLVDTELQSTGGLASATDDEVVRAVDAVIARFGPQSDVLGLSQLTIQRDGRWVSPAVFMTVVSDNNVLGFGNTSVNLGGDTAVEEYNRELQSGLRSAPGWQVNGVAIDVNLTSQEQGAVAGPFIGFTVLAALLLSSGSRA